MIVVERIREISKEKRYKVFVSKRSGKHEAGVGSPKYSATSKRSRSKRTPVMKPCRYSMRYLRNSVKRNWKMVGKNVLSRVKGS